MADQKHGSDQSQQGMTMAEYQQVSSMAQNSMAPNTQVQVSMAMTQAQLPTLAPAPPHGQPMTPHGPGMQGMQGAPAQGGQPGAMPPQPQMQMQQAMGQQFQVISPNFTPGGQYATFPQYATYNQQGQLVLQPAQFAMQGPGGQGQQIILSGVPQQPGKPMPMGSQPSGPNKPIPGQQPQFTITSSGQLQMAVPSGQSQGQTFMLAPQMSGMPGMPGMPSTIAGQNGQSQTGMKGSDGKPMQGPPQMSGQPTAQQPQFVLSPGMPYMQSGPQQILQNGQQLIYRSPGQEQPLMFSPTGQPPQGPPQAQPPHPNSLPPPPSAMPGMTMPGTAVRPSNMPSGAPPGKTAISRAIAPLPSTTQTNARNSYNPTAGNLPNQPSPKSKQKMSPRGNNVGPGRPPGPKTQNAPKMMPRMAGGAGSSPMPGSPGSPTMNPGSPRPPMLQNASSPGPHLTPMSQSGPPTLTPMMFPTQPAPQNTVVPPQSVPVSLPLMTHSVPPKPLYQMPAASTSIPTTSVPPTPIQANSESSFGPPTLTKEVNPPMPNLGPPNISNPPSLDKAPSNTNSSKVSTTPSTQTNTTASTDGEAGLVPTPKCVVKPQVLTHVIDGHIIKESSQPFPVSPSKKRSANGMSKTINDLEKMLDKDIEASSLSAPVRRKSEKDDKSAPPSSTAPIKRGPGRPPGSNNKTSEQNVKAKSTGEPPEKKSKPDKESVAPLTNGSSLNKPTPPTPAPAPPVQPPLTAIVKEKDNPLKWNVSQVCDFIKNLPGCSDYVEDFAVQEIDGQALMLLQADHLMTAMSIKLGPALKICEQVKHLKDELNKN